MVSGALWYHFVIDIPDIFNCFCFEVLIELYNGLVHDFGFNPSKQSPVRLPRIMNPKPWYNLHYTKKNKKKQNKLVHISNN